MNQLDEKEEEEAKNSIHKNDLGIIEEENGDGEGETKDSIKPSKADKKKEKKNKEKNNENKK